MATPPPPKEGSIVHVEIHSGDPTRTKEFFGDVFGWKFQDMPDWNYSLWEAPAQPGGGLQKHAENRGPTVLDYIYANDIDATLRRIASAGGRVLEKKQEIPGFGWWAVFEEPGGTTMALYQASQPQTAQRSARQPPRRRSAARTGARKARSGGKRKR